jgi:cobalt-zinc-cadmium efflux system outer membrane protein
MFIPSDRRLRRRVSQILTASGAITFMLAANPVSAQSLTMSDVLARAMADDPTTAVSGAQVEAGEAAARQAGVRPLSVIGIDVEDFAGTGPYSPLNRSQTTAWYERPLERGSKREARIDAARADIAVTRGRGAVRSLDLIEQVQTAWVEAMTTEAAIGVAEERLAIASRLEADVARRVANAVDPIFARERARTAVVQAQITRDQAHANARIARTSLAAWWGGTDAYRLDLSPFDRSTATAVSEAGSPDLNVIAAARDAADARLRLAEAGNYANPMARVGVRHFGQGNEVALVVGGSIPLGARAANRGNVDRARAERQAVEAEIAVARLQRDREINRLTAEQRAIRTEIDRIEREVLPGATRTVALIRDGYVRGGTAFTVLEWTTAQTVVTDARMRRIDLLRRYHLHGVRLDRLNGRHAPLLARAEAR